MNKEDLEELQAILNMEAEAESKLKKGGMKIDIMGIVKVLWAKRKYYFISVPVAAVVAIALSLCIPKTYQVNVMLAPELSTLSGATAAGGLGSMMKTMGLGSLTSSQSGDAIMPNLYPNLVASQAFMVSMFDIPIITSDGQVRTTYFDYLSRYQKFPWWGKYVRMVKSLIPNFNERTQVSKDAKVQVLKKAPETTGDTLQADKPKTHRKHRINPTFLSERQTAIVDAMYNSISCEIDSKTYVITISATSQDPLVSAIIADSACQHLQDFITEYRTKKARVEYNHLLEQYSTAKTEYEAAKETVATFNDANWDIVQEEFAIQKQAQQNEMQLRFSAISSINQQLIASRAKLDEANPVFTVLNGATVPLDPVGPKKKQIVVGIVFMVAFVQTLWFLWKELKRKKKEEPTQPVVEE